MSGGKVRELNERSPTLSHLSHSRPGKKEPKISVGYTRARFLSNCSCIFATVMVARSQGK